MNSSSMKKQRAEGGGSSLVGTLAKSPRLQDKKERGAVEEYNISEYNETVDSMLDDYDKQNGKGKEDEYAVTEYNETVDSMLDDYDKQNDKKRKSSRRDRSKSRFSDRRDDGHPDEAWLQEERRAHERQKEKKAAWRFVPGDRVRCWVGDDWASGAVQAVDQPDEESGSLPYVVNLDSKRLISVPTDGNHCIRPDGCFSEEGLFFGGGEPRGELCKAVVRGARKTKGGDLRFEVGARVACLNAGPEGTEWPRRWSAGTVVSAWCQLTKRDGGAAFVPYSVALDTPGGGLGKAKEAAGHSADGQLVLVPKDSHLFVRALELQAAGECPQGKPLTRFAQRHNKENGWDEQIDQHTQKVRKE